LPLLPASHPRMPGLIRSFAFAFASQSSKSKEKKKISATTPKNRRNEKRIFR
jgi:hypothetical protein